MFMENIFVRMFAGMTTLVKKASNEKMVRISGYSGTKIVSESALRLLVENIDAHGIHYEHDAINLDGGFACNAIKKILSENSEIKLSSVDSMYLRIIDDMACESCAMTFVGNIMFHDVSENLINLANERGASTEFKMSDMVWNLAREAAKTSGRPLSMAR